MSEKLFHIRSFWANFYLELYKFIRVGSQKELMEKHQLGSPTDPKYGVEKGNFEMIICPKR